MGLAGGMDVGYGGRAGHTCDIPEQTRSRRRTVWAGMLKILVTGTILAMQLRSSDAFVTGVTCLGLAGCPSLRSSCRLTNHPGARMSAEGFEGSSRRSVDAERDDVVGDAANKKAHNRIEFGGTGGVPVGLSGASNKEKSQIQRSRSRGHGTKTTKLASTPPSPTKSFDGTKESIEEDRESVVDCPMSTSLCEETVPQWQNEMMIQALDTHLEIKDSCKVYPEVACMVDEAFTGLNDIFFGKDGYLISEQEATKIIESGGGATYGEVLPTGCDQILHFFGMDENSVFADLGAGTGRMCLHISAARKLKKVVGVELANSRLDYGREALFRMQEEMGIDMTPVEFIAKDLAECDFAEFSHIFVSSVCFQDNLLRTVAKKCSEGENFRILMSLKELPLQPFLAKLGDTRIPCTFHGSQPAYLYGKHGARDIPPSVLANLFCKDGACWLPLHLHKGENLHVAPPYID